MDSTKKPLKFTSLRSWEKADLWRSFFLWDVLLVTDWLSGDEAKWLSESTSAAWEKGVISEQNKQIKVKNIKNILRLLNDSAYVFSQTWLFL